MTAGPPSLNRLSRIALLVAVGDLSTKFIASRLWAERPVHLSDWISMAVVHNDAGAFGLSVGAYTWQLNLALTLAAVVFIIPVTRDLGHIDRRAPTALGLIVGGALGNLASLVLPPRGVMDFISLNWSPGHSLVLNVADVAAYTGLAMILRTGLMIAAALRRESRLATDARVGSAFAEKFLARQELRGAHVSAPRPQLREELVMDWSRVADPAVVRADAPAPVSDLVPRIADAALMRAELVLDDAPSEAAARADRVTQA